MHMGGGIAAVTGNALSIRSSDKKEAIRVMNVL